MIKYGDRVKFTGNKRYIEVNYGWNEQFAPLLVPDSVFTVLSVVYAPHSLNSEDFGMFVFAELDVRCIMPVDSFTTISNIFDITEEVITNVRQRLDNFVTRYNNVSIEALYLDEKYDKNKINCIYTLVDPKTEEKEYLCSYYTHDNTLHYYITDIQDIFTKLCNLIYKKISKDIGTKADINVYKEGLHV